MSPAAYGLRFDGGFGAAPGWVWCQRAIAHCGAVMEATIAMAGRGGGGREEAEKGWRGLCAENERWFASVPAEFEPWFGGWGGRGEGEGEGGMFPVVRFLACWHGEFLRLSSAREPLCLLFLIWIACAGSYGVFVHDRGASAAHGVRPDDPEAGPVAQAGGCGDGCKCC